ncbi:hypothetical protein JL720_16057 [Aureococcus anophagefferens]|nr:hypothetical protein JL720_16057 [Aureococcus anophagefferens]
MPPPSSPEIVVKCYYGDAKGVADAIAAGADLLEVACPAVYSGNVERRGQPDPECGIALHYACFYAHIDCVRELLATGCHEQLDWRRAETGATPLVLLCQHAGQAACSVNPHQLADTLACVELLLEAGAALEPRTTKEHTNPRPVGAPSAEARRCGARGSEPAAGLAPSRSWRRGASAAREDYRRALVDLSAQIRAARQATGPAELATEEILAASPWLGDGAEAFFRAHPFPRPRSGPAQRQLGYWKGVASGLFPPGEGEGVVGGEIAERVPETRPVEVDDVKGSTWVAVVLVQAGDGALSARVVAELWTLAFDGAGAAATAACGGLFDGAAALRLDARCEDPCRSSPGPPGSGIAAGDLAVHVAEFGKMHSDDGLRYHREQRGLTLLFLKRAARRRHGAAARGRAAPCDTRLIEGLAAGDAAPSGPLGLLDAGTATGVLTHLRHIVDGVAVAARDLLLRGRALLRGRRHAGQVANTRDLRRKIPVAALGWYLYPSERWEEACARGRALRGARGARRRGAALRSARGLVRPLGGAAATSARRSRRAARSGWYADLVVEFAANYLAFCVHARELEPPRAMQRAFGLAAPSRAAVLGDRGAVPHPAWGAAFDRVASFLVFMFPDQASLKELFLSYATEVYELPADWLGPAAGPSSASARELKTPPRRARA